jgi:hypothetical protein
LNIFEAIAYIMKKGYSVSKDRKNEQQRFFYRGIDDVMNVFQPLMAEAGIFLVPEVLEAKREDRQTAKGGNLIYSVLKMKYTFYASDGSSVSAVVIGEGMDSGDKASNKAMAVAMKYAMFQVFCIPTEELDDPDAATPPPSVPAPPPMVCCEKCGTPLKGIRRKDGTIVTIPELVQYSKDNYQGRTLCRQCMKEEKE